jgi:hypothetical protein
MLENVGKADGAIMYCAEKRREKFDTLLFLHIIAALTFRNKTTKYFNKPVPDQQSNLTPHKYLLK